MNITTCSDCLIIEAPDDIEDSAFRHPHLDGIGYARYFDTNILNQHGKIEDGKVKLNTH